MKNKILFILSLLMISISCQKEEPIVVSQGEERIVSLDSVKNQGTNIYTDRLVGYYDKYSVLTMYQFDTTLFQYEVTNRPKYRYKDADEKHVGKLLDILDELFYKQIGDMAIIKYNPLNVLLVSDLEKIDEIDELKKFKDCYFGRYSLTFSGADSKIGAWDKDRKIEFKNYVISQYLLRMLNNGLVDYPATFSMVSIYNNSRVNSSNYKEYGFILDDGAYWKSMPSDFTSYIDMIIENTKEELEADGGLLNPSVDVNGLIKRKYDVVVKFFKECDIDLVKIANYEIK